MADSRAFITVKVITCTRCHGLGQVPAIAEDAPWFMVPCGQCRGSGVIP